MPGCSRSTLRYAGSVRRPSPPLRLSAAAGLLLSSCLVLGGCGGSSGAEAEHTSGADTTPIAEEPVPSRTSETEASAPETSAPETSAPALEGKTVALDPGHNGANARNASEVNRQVPDGRGGTKACNTTGTATAGDYAEHAFTFDVAERARTLLEDAGAEVVMSREDDEGVGPCVDERGQFAGEAGADVLVSIHANGTEDTSARGFHVIVVEDAQHEGVEEPSQALAEQMVAAFEDADFAPNPAYGADGIVARTDIAGLNHASVPAVLVECGEMRNPDEAAVMESEEGRQRYAEAITAGVTESLAEN